jgi:hypothetical protein
LRSSAFPDRAGPRILFERMSICLVLVRRDW